VQRRTARRVVRRWTPATLVAVAGWPTRASAWSTVKTMPDITEGSTDMGSAQNIVTPATVAQMSPAFLQIVDMMSAPLRFRVSCNKLDVAVPESLIQINSPFPGAVELRLESVGCPLLAHSGHP
jgi:hypothetical protein